jgi:4-carboxymuconolactone decarboxylase
MVADGPSSIERRTTGNRIGLAPVEGLSPRMAELLDSTKGLNGERVLNIFATLAHHPRALRHSVALGGAFLFAGNIDQRIREIVILRVGRNTRCEYEYAQHFLIGQNCDLTADECRAVLQPDLGTTFSDFERTVVAAVDEICDDDCVSDATWSALAAQWDERELVELVMLAGYYRMLAGFLNSAGVPIDDGLKGFDA